jgi:putative tryptophan/tyrosine transport system substrate-binding protein
MKRREFIAIAGAAGASILKPFRASAQQVQNIRRIGILSASNETDRYAQERLDAFRQGLEALGWFEGRNIHIDYRFATVDQLQAYAKELVDLKPEAILANSTPCAAALQQQTRDIPIVFLEVSDPIGSGFIESLARPGGNLTGLMLNEEGVSGKWLAMLKDIAPALTHAAIMANPRTTPYDYFLRGALPAAKSLAIELLPGQVETPADIERIIEELSRLPNSGLITPPDSTIGRNRSLIISLTAQHRLPTLYSNAFAVHAGGLMSYSPDRIDGFRQSASYFDSILHGKKPADLPVQTPTKYETALNLTTAKTLGLTIPPSLLAIADEVIE